MRHKNSRRDVPATQSRPPQLAHEGALKLGLSACLHYTASKGDWCQAEQPNTSMDTKHKKTKSYHLPRPSFATQTLSACLRSPTQREINQPILMLESSINTAVAVKRYTCEGTRVIVPRAVSVIFAGPRSWGSLLVHLYWAAATTTKGLARMLVASPQTNNKKQKKSWGKGSGVAFRLSQGYAASYWYIRFFFYRR